MAVEGRKVIIDGQRSIKLEVYSLSTSELGEKEFIVRNRFTAISAGTELSIYTGINPGVHENGSWCEYPHNPGYAGIGEVISVGSNVTDVKIGDFVFHHAHHSTFDKLHEEHSHYLKLLGDMFLPEVSLVRFAAIVLSGSIRLSDITLGCKVALLGLGIVGQMAAQLFSLAGCDVVAFDPIQKRREIAQNIGSCLAVFDPSQNKPKDVISNSINGLKGVDLLVDATGSSSLIMSNIELVRPMGQVILLGTPFESYKADVTPLLRTTHLKRLVIRGALERDIPRVPKGNVETYSYLSDVRYLFDLLKRKKLKCKELVSHIIQPVDIKVAYEGLLNKKEEYMSVVLDWAKV